jgi:hypothetical protein
VLKKTVAHAGPQSFHRARNLPALCWHSFEEQLKKEAEAKAKAG